MSKPHRRQGTIRPVRDMNGKIIPNLWEIGLDIGGGTTVTRQRHSERVHGTNAEAKRRLQ